MNDRHLTVLAIDDDPGDVELLRRYMDDIPEMTITLKHANNAPAGLEDLKDSKIDVVFLDYLLGDQNGMDVLEQVRASGDLRGVIVMTGQTSAPLAVSLTHAGADDYIDKHSMNPDVLRRAIDHANAQQCRRQANEHNKLLLNELQQANRLLEQKNTRLAELYNTAYQFVDNVSHEFRTPLAVIKEYASLVRDGVLGQVNDEQEEFLDVIGNRVEDLVLMVDDMLDTSRFGAGMLQVRRKPCRIEDIIEHIQPNLDRRAVIKKLQLEIGIEQQLPEIYCDAEKIGRTIINLAVNALKFAPEGGQVRLWVRGEAHDGQVVVGVSDNGPGISPENQRLIFERFKQVNGEVQQSTKGFGLGLNIAKELVHANFGQITIESEVGQGSTFSFTVPTAEPMNVIGRYLGWLEQAQTPVPVSMIWVRTQGLADPGIVKEIDGFLQTLARPKDLVFTPAAGAWLLVTQCEQAELHQLIQRYEETRDQTNRNRPNGQLPTILYEKLGTWSVPEEGGSFLERFKTTLIPGEVAYG